MAEVGQTVASASKFVLRPKSAYEYLNLRGSSPTLFIKSPDVGPNRRARMTTSEKFALATTDPERSHYPKAS